MSNIVNKRHNTNNKTIIVTLSGSPSSGKGWAAEKLKVAILDKLKHDSNAMMPRIECLSMLNFQVMRPYKKPLESAYVMASQEANWYDYDYLFDCLQKLGNGMVELSIPNFNTTFEWFEEDRVIQSPDIIILHGQYANWDDKIREMSVCNVIIGNNMLDYNNPIIHRPYLENYKCSTNKDLWDVVEGARRSYNKIIENGDFIVRPSCLFPRVGDILTNDIIHRWKTAKILRNSLKPSNNLSKWPVLKR